MATTQHVSTRRRAVVALLAVIVVATAAVTGISTSGSTEEDEDELVGIAGRQRIVVNPPGTIEAAFAHESYRPGMTAELRLFGDVRRLTIRLFRSGPEGIVTRRNDMMFGVEVAPRKVVASAHRGSVVRIRVGRLAERPLLRTPLGTRRANRVRTLRRRPTQPRRAPRRRRHADEHVVRVRRS